MSSSSQDSHWLSTLTGSLLSLALCAISTGLRCHSDPRPRARAPESPAAFPICLDNSCDQRVADDICGGEMDKADPLDAVQKIEGLDESRAHATRQVDLGRIAGHGHPAALAHSGQEHLHLH